MKFGTLTSNCYLYGRDCMREAKDLGEGQRQVRDLKRGGVLHIRRGIGRDIEYSQVILLKKIKLK